VPRGKITLTEPFHFQGKTLEGVERHPAYAGPDPDGRLAAVWNRLQQKLNAKAFPDKDHALTKNFLNETLPYLAPHVLVKPGEVALLDLKEKEAPFSPKEREIYGFLNKIQEGLIPYLHGPQVDPRFRTQILRALRDTLYQKTGAEAKEQGPDSIQGKNTIQILTDLNDAEQARLNPLRNQMYEAESKIPPDEKLAFELRKKIAPIQDRKLLIDVLLSLGVGRPDKAVGLVAQFSAPPLRRMMDETLGAMQRRENNHEGLELMEAVGFDLIVKEAEGSDKWFGGKSFNQAEAEKSLRSLVGKAHHQTDLADGTSPLAVMDALKDLTEGEKAERNKLKASYIIKQLNGIAQEPLRDGRGRQYFTFARSTLMGAGLVSSATFVGKWVALHHMPPTRSLEGLKVLEALGEFQLQETQQKIMQKGLSEHQRVALALQPEILAQLPQEEVEQIQKEFAEKYPELSAQLAQDTKFLTDFRAFFSLDQNSQQEFEERIKKSHGPMLLQLRDFVFYTQYLLFKVQKDLLAQPEKSFKEILMNVQGLAEAEEGVRKEILQDPFLMALIKQSEAPTLEARLQGYQEIFKQVSAKSPWAPHIPGFLAYVRQNGVPKEKNQDIALMLEIFLTGKLRQLIVKVITQPYQEELKKDLQPKAQQAYLQMMEDSFIQTQGQQLIFAKARDKAVSRPEMNPLELLNLVSDEELDKDLEEGLKKMDPQGEGYEEQEKAIKKIYKAAKAQRKFLSMMPINQAFTPIFEQANGFKRQEAYHKLFRQNIARVNYLQTLIGLKTGQIEMDEESAKKFQKIFDQANFSAEAKAQIELLKKAEAQQQTQAVMGNLLKAKDFQFASFVPVMFGLEQQLGMGELMTPSAQEIMAAWPELTQAEQVQLRMTLLGRLPPGLTKEEQAQVGKMLSGSFPPQLTEEEQVQLRKMLSGRFTPDLSEEEQVQLRNVLSGRFPSHDLADFLAHTEGNAKFTYKLEYGIPALFKEVSKPTVLAAMTGAMALGPVAEASILLRAGSSSLASLGATAGGVAAEGLVMNTGQKILDSAFISKKGQWSNWWGDQKATWLTFGLWRAGGSVVRQYGRELLATGKVGSWAGGPAVVRDIPFKADPLGRLQIAKAGADGVFYQSTRAGAMVEGLAQHGVGIGSIMGAQTAASALEWQHEGKAKNFSERLFDATSFYFTGLVSGMVVQGLPLGGMHASVAALRYKSEMQRLEKHFEQAKNEPSIPELVDRKLVAEQLDALQKRAEEIEKETAIPTLPAEIANLRLALRAPWEDASKNRGQGRGWEPWLRILDPRRKGKNEIQVDGKFGSDQWQEIPEME
jgi:hypothetical protein